MRPISPAFVVADTLRCYFPFGHNKVRALNHKPKFHLAMQQTTFDGGYPLVGAGQSSESQLSPVLINQTWRRSAKFSSLTLPTASQ